MVIKRRRAFLSLTAVVAAAALTVPLLGVGAISAASAAAKPRQATTSLPRNETLYSTGMSYTAGNFNPNQPGNYSFGTEGLLYETLYLYNPIKNTYIPWLAQSGSWTTPTTYALTIRNNITWTDGTPMTAQDVAFTINLASTDPGIYYSSLAADVKSVSVTGTDSLVVTFNHPSSEDWQQFLYSDPILPQHIMGTWSNTELNTSMNATPVGSGPFTLYSTNAEEVVYTVYPKWWGTTDLGVHFAFTYWANITSPSNNVSLSDLLQDQVDLDNNELAGISTLVASPISTGNLSGTGGFNLETYYPKSPYMLSANTVWLEPNLIKAPTSNLNFRKAVAYAIDPQQIVQIDYAGIVAAANPTGLMPSQFPYLDKAALAKYGFSYNVALAKKYLAMSGYKHQVVTIECPTGWTDWMGGIEIVVNDLKAVGINAKAYFPSYAARTSDLEDGTFDFALDNNATIAADPYAYFYREFRLPISKVQSAQDNMERANNPTAWALVQKLNSTPPTDTSARLALFGQLETIELQTLPEIPLWYNGAWAQYNTSVWTNWPSSTNPSNQYTPVTWGGWLGNMTTILAVAQLKLAS